MSVCVCVCESEYLCGCGVDDWIQQITNVCAYECMREIHRKYLSGCDWWLNRLIACVCVCFHVCNTCMYICVLHAHQMHINSPSILIDFRQQIFARKHTRNSPSVYRCVRLYTWPLGRPAWRELMKRSTRGENLFNHTQSPSLACVFRLPRRDVCSKAREREREKERERIQSACKMASKHKQAAPSGTFLNDYQ